MNSPECRCETLICPCFSLYSRSLLKADSHCASCVSHSKPMSISRRIRSLERVPDFLLFLWLDTHAPSPDDSYLGTFTSPFSALYERSSQNFSSQRPEKRSQLQPGNASSRALRSGEMFSLFPRWVVAQPPSRYPSAVLCSTGTLVFPFRSAYSLRWQNPSSH